MALPRFPELPGIGWPTRRIVWNTVKQQSLSGRKVAFPTRSLPLWSWELDIEFLRSRVSSGLYSEVDALIGLYNTCAGSAYAFSYRDREDNTAVAQFFGSGDGISSQFQLCRSRGGFSEPVYLPEPGAQIFVNSARLSSGYTVGDTGVVTFSSPPQTGAQLTWSGEFRWIARFDEDTVDLTALMSGVTSVSKIKFTSEIL